MRKVLALALTAVLCLTGINCKSYNREQIMAKIDELEKIFSEMVENDGTFGAQWKNIPLGKKAFALMKDELPLRVKGELTPYTRIVLLNKMMSCMPERDCARFFREVKHYQKSLFRLVSDKDINEDMDIDGYEGAPEKYVRGYSKEEHRKSLERTEEYLDSSISMEDWCEKYRIMLKFDPVERTRQWEECIYDVEKECEEKLVGEHRGMGFCYSYWSTKKSVLSKYGIEWDSPSTMNPRVMFD